MLYRNKASQERETFSSVPKVIQVPEREENLNIYSLNYFTEKLDRPLTDKLEYGFAPEDQKDIYKLSADVNKKTGNSDLLSVTNYAGQYLFYRIKSTDQKFSSKARFMKIPPRQKKFEYSINYDTRSTNEEFGYDIEISKYPNMYDSKEGQGRKLKLDGYMGGYMYVRRMPSLVDNLLGSEVVRQFVPGDLKIVLLDPDKVSVERKERAYIFFPKNPDDGEELYASEDQINAALALANANEQGEPQQKVLAKLINRENNLWLLEYRTPNVTINLNMPSQTVEYNAQDGETYYNFSSVPLEVIYRPVDGEILAYPSPLGSNQGEILTVEGKEDIYDELKVFDMNGRQVFYFNIKELDDKDPRNEVWKRYIDFSGKPKGMYFIHLIDKEGGKSPVQTVLKI